MELSSTLCRVQETYQRDRAASAKLENVRLVADRAAKAWEVEALAAEERDARREKTRLWRTRPSIQHDRPRNEPVAPMPSARSV